MRKLLLVIVGLVSLLVGCNRLGSRGDFYAETYFIYRPIRLPITLESRADLNANTVRRMIVVPSNLEKVTEHLKLEASVDELEAAISTTVIPSTFVLRIRVAWPTEDGAVAIANTMREVFIQGQLDERRHLLTEMLDNLQSQLTASEAELQRALERQRKKRAELRKTEQLAPDVINAKLEDIDRRRESIELELLADRRRLAEAEALVSQVQTEDQTAIATSNQQARANYLRDEMNREKQKAEAIPRLKAATAAYDRAKEAYAKGLISQTQYDERKADLGYWQAVVSESSQERKTRAEYEAAAKSSFVTTTSTTNALMQDALRRRAEASIALQGDQAKLEGLNVEYVSFEEQRDAWEGANPDMVRLNREVRVLRTQTDELTDSIPRVRKALDSRTTDFVLISEAGSAKQVRQGPTPEEE